MPDPTPPLEDRRQPVLAKVFRSALTGPDDRSYELAELMIGFGFIVGIILEIIDFALQWIRDVEGSFNFLTYMTALGVGAGAVFAGQRLRDGKTPPT